jgi:hypothetical protein
MLQLELDGVPARLPDNIGGERFEIRLLVAIAEATTQHGFTIEALHQAVLNPFDRTGDVVLGDRAFLTSPLKAGGQFFFGKHLTTSIPFHDHQGVVFDLLVGGEPMLASQAFAPTPDGGPFLGGSGVDDLVILTAAFGTAHISR